MKAVITKEMIDAITKRQIQVLQDWWNQNATLPMKVQAEGKTIKGAHAFIKSVARRVAENGMAMISDNDVYGLLVHYMADEQEGATYGGSDEKPERIETEAERLEKMSDEERKAYIERKNAEEAARKAAEAEKARKIAERTAREAAKAAKAEALKRAAEAQMLLFT